MSPQAQPDRQNRRRCLRHKVHAPAYATFRGASAGAMLDLNEILNISEDGVAIQCAAPLDVSRSVDLCLDLSESSGQIYTTGHVVWSDSTGRVGMRFPTLPASSLVRLREWLFLNAMAAVSNARSPLTAASRDGSDHPLDRPNYTDVLAAVSAAQREAESLGADLNAVLQLVASRSHALLRATGAAVALAAQQPEFMICRASAGDAPPVGAKLQLGSGFSGECVRTGRLLRCDDAETDSRVDAESCRRLNIRSILAAPVRLGDRVVGILETFSQRAHAFSEHDSAVLQRFAETILAAVNRAARSENLLPPAPAPASFAPPQGSVLFASEAKAKTEDAGLPDSDENPGGVRLPRSLLIILICAAAAISLVLGVILAPWIQSKIHNPAAYAEQTVLASSRAPAQPAATPPPTAVTASLEQLRQLAQKGDPSAENALGIRFAAGDGVRQDDAEAAHWFTKAAEHLNVNAQATLGTRYWVGRGVPQSLTQAYFWTVLARAQGDQDSKMFAQILTTHLTRAQAATIEQQAEQWYRQHQSAKPEAGH